MRSEIHSDSKGSVKKLCTYSCRAMGGQSLDLWKINTKTVVCEEKLFSCSYNPTKMGRTSAETRWLWSNFLSIGKLLKPKKSISIHIFLSFFSACHFSSSNLLSLTPYNRRNLLPGFNLFKFILRALLRSIRMAH